MNILKKFALAAIAATALSATAGAQTVAYTTSGFFSGGSCTGTNVCSTSAGDNFARVTFVGGSFSATAPSNISFGDFLSTVTGTGGTFAAGTTFTLVVNQTVPSVGGPVSPTGSFTGTLTSSSSGIIWTPSITNFVLGTAGAVANYTLQSPALIVPPSTNNGATTIEGIVTVPAQVVPEPSSIALMAAGIASLGMVARRRRENA